MKSASKIRESATILILHYCFNINHLSIHFLYSFFQFSSNKDSLQLFYVYKGFTISLFHQQFINCYTDSRIQMQNSSERDKSFSPDSESQFENPLVSEQAEELDIDYQNLSQQVQEYSKEYFIHKHNVVKNQFPFYLYLRQKYQIISLKKQLEICCLYFSPIHSNIKNPQNQIQSCHIKGLNSGINLFSKLPMNPLLFITIRNHSQQNLIAIVSNSYSEIINYQIFNRRKNKTIILLQIKRKLYQKGHPLMFIRDQTNMSQSGLNFKSFQKLSKSINYHYVKFFNSPDHKNYLKKQLLGQTDHQFKTLNGIRRTIFEVNEKQLWVYSSKFKNMPIQTIREQKNQFYTISNKIQEQQSKLILQQTNSKALGIRFYTLDTLYFNYLKTTENNKTQFIRQIQKLQSRIVPVRMKDINEEVDHYPERLMSCRRCKNCEIKGVPGNKKSKFKCMACSKKYRIDFPLCISCFGDFHEIVLPTCHNVHPRRMKKAYLQSIKKQEHSQLQKERQDWKTNTLQPVKYDVVKLYSNFEQIKGIMKEIEEEQPQCINIVKKFNESLFLSILDCFNIMFRKMQENDQTVKEEAPDQ